MHFVYQTSTDMNYSLNCINIQVVSVLLKQKKNILFRNFLNFNFKISLFTLLIFVLTLFSVELMLMFLKVC